MGGERGNPASGTSPGPASPVVDAPRKVSRFGVLEVPQVIGGRCWDTWEFTRRPMRGRRRVPLW